MTTPRLRGGRTPWWARSAQPICVFALVLRALVVAWAWERVPPTADGRFYHIVAQRLANGDGYTWLWPDGVVTFAAHYPVGYPGFMAPIYAAFGPVPGLVMVANALVGAVLVWCVYDLSLWLLREMKCESDARLAATGVALFAALSPTLLGYTPALMTEAAVACLLLAAVRICIAERGGVALRGLLVAMIVGGATMLRPQSILFAPVLGALLCRSTWWGATMSGALVLLGALLCTAPWVLRNCEQMGHCSFVSANGGWNLLIGTFPEGNGAWVALEGEKIPVRCREVFHEAEKDVCFKEAGVERILAEPKAWLALIPAKLRATFDFGAAAAGHLSEAGALDGWRLEWLKSLEVVWQRLLLILAGVGAWRLVASSGDQIRARVSAFLLFAIVVGAAGGGAWWACALVCVLLLLRPKVLFLPPVGYGFCAVLATLAVHAAFFGAARYSLPAYIALLPMTALAFSGLLNWVRARGGASDEILSERF